MKHKSGLTKAVSVLILGACSITGISSELPGTPAGDAIAVAAEPSETILLVSLEDGTVIKQMISVNADICFKQNTNSATICLTEGEPVLDESTNAVIGFQMIENEIELIAKFD
ncbi:MAG: hypothetical protein KJO31_07855 [Gammaproteobacteria bacterium]|nr:hypothetical protein [Gammaproteobacteria bacterium]